MEEKKIEWETLLAKHFSAKLFDLAQLIRKSSIYRHLKNIFQKRNFELTFKTFNWINIAILDTKYIATKSSNYHSLHEIWFSKYMILTMINIWIRNFATITLNREIKSNKLLFFS